MAPKVTKADLLAAVGKTVPDVIAPDLNVLFCGINPGLLSGATGHHFARPGNRFWPTLHAAGFTDRVLSPVEEQKLLKHGYGITNIVERATATAAELEPDELAEGGQRLAAKIKAYRPRCVAMLGIGAYRTAWAQPKATLGRQPETLHNALLWVLPNPSGLNAHYRLADFARLFGELRVAVAEGNR